MNVKIILRRDTSQNWSTNNPVLLEGEAGYETDSKKLKIGNGTDEWNSLSYFASSNSNDTTYSINNVLPDENGNFNIDFESINAASKTHTHQISDIVNLKNELNNKSPITHTHDMVKSITVNNNKILGDVKLIGNNNINITSQNNIVNFELTPYTINLAETIKDNGTDTTPISMFFGTQSEWNSFKKNIPNNSKYLVFIKG